MSDIVIRVENLSKRYTIRHAKGGASGDGLRHVIQDTVVAPFRALRKMGSRKAKSENRDSETSPSEFRIPNSDFQEDFYALRDVSFEVKRGEVVGIIGRNGAGKSTLLKILSRITEPTSGRIGIKGRVASLLEVGTGFHPELTGRENIYLNGAILGMTRAEVKRKFDEIVEFSGVEKFLDTPVKRYSSGMYVRLAFAVAAHLEPEILIVDEVLAVGDAEFQKKCIGRMSAVAAEGRTVLFVSHNLSAVRRLCTSGLLMNNGTTSGLQSIESALAEYSFVSDRSAWTIDASGIPRSSQWGTQARVTKLISDSTNPTYGTPWTLSMAIVCREAVKNAIVSIAFTSLEGNRVMTLDSDIGQSQLHLHIGTNQVRIMLDYNLLHPGLYTIGCSIWKGNLILDAVDAIAVWEVYSRQHDNFSYRGFGASRPLVKVEGFPSHT